MTCVSSFPVNKLTCDLEHNWLSFSGFQRLSTLPEVIFSCFYRVFLLKTVKAMTRHLVPMTVSPENMENVLCQISL
jgi:hypothetical protein